MPVSTSDFRLVSSDWVLLHDVMVYRNTRFEASFGPVLIFRLLKPSPKTCYVSTMQQDKSAISSATRIE